MNSKDKLLDLHASLELAEQKMKNEELAEAFDIVLEIGYQIKVEQSIIEDPNKEIMLKNIINRHSYLNRRLLKEMSKKL